MSERSAEAVLEDSFLEVRAKLIEVAATLDRIDHARSATRSVSADTSTPGVTTDDSEQRARIDAAIRILLDDDGNGERARDLQLLFSREYDPDWRARMQV